MYKTLFLFILIVASAACTRQNVINNQSQGLTIDGEPLVTMMIGTFHCDNERDAQCVQQWNRDIERFNSCTNACEQTCSGPGIPNPNCDTGGQFPVPPGCDDISPGSLEHRQLCIMQCEFSCGAPPKSLNEACPINTIQAECSDCILEPTPTYKVCQIPNIFPGRPVDDFFPRAFPCDKSFEGTSIQCAPCQPSPGYYLPGQGLGPLFGKKKCTCPTNDSTWSFSCRIPVEIPAYEKD